MITMPSRVLGDELREQVLTTPATVDLSPGTPEGTGTLRDAELREAVLESDRCIRRTWINVRKQSMEIGWEAAFLERHNAWQFLGFKHQHAYRIAVGIGRSNWYRLMAIAQKFPELSKEQFLAMSIENAERLGLEPKEVRYDPELLLKAATRQARDFKDELTTLGAHREGRPLHEHWVTMEWRLREEQRAAIERGLGEWQQEHGIDDEGYALELLIAEYRERPTLVGFINESIYRLKREVEEAEDLGRLRGSCLLLARDMGEILKVCCGEQDRELCEGRV